MLERTKSSQKRANELHPAQTISRPENPVSSSIHLFAINLLPPQHFKLMLGIRQR
jgi:hypothetical protein